MSTTAKLVTGDLRARRLYMAKRDCLEQYVVHCTDQSRKRGWSVEASSTSRTDVSAMRIRVRRGTASHDGTH